MPKRGGWRHMLHRHHRVPRYAGGTDDPSNIVELTVIDHAIAHKVLYHFYKREEDLIAYRGLLGIAPRETIVQQALSMAGSRGGKKDGWAPGTHPSLGKPRPDLVKRNRSKENRIKVSVALTGRRRIDMLGNQWARAGKNRPKAKCSCVQCRLVVGTNALPIHLRNRHANP